MLNDKLKQYRKARGWTQDDLAERSGFSRSSIINWESGKRAPRTVDIDKLAMVLGVSARDLVTDASNTANNEIPQNTWLLPASLRQETGGGFAYWGGVVDMAIKLADSKNLQQIKTVAHLLKIAYDTLLQTLQEQNASQEAVASVSAYNGDHSTYKGNTLTLGKAIA